MEKAAENTPKKNMKFNREHIERGERNLFDAWGCIDLPLRTTLRLRNWSRREWQGTKTQRQDLSIEMGYPARFDDVLTDNGDVDPDVCSSVPILNHDSGSYGLYEPEARCAARRSQNVR